MTPHSGVAGSPFISNHVDDIPSVMVRLLSGSSTLEKVIVHDYYDGRGWSHYQSWIKGEDCGRMVSMDGAQSLRKEHLWWDWVESK